MGSNGCFILFLSRKESCFNEHLLKQDSYLPGNFLVRHHLLDLPAQLRLKILQSLHSPSNNGSRICCHAAEPMHPGLDCQKWIHNMHIETQEILPQHIW